MMTPEDTNAIAEALFQAEIDGKQIGIPSLAHPGMTMDDAYAIQADLVARKLAAGDGIIGWKIGLTSKAMQSALNIDIPDSGILFESMRFANGSTVPKGRFIEPRIEAEIAFVMKEAVGAEDVTRESIIAATDYVAPAVEILDTRIVRKDAQTGKARKVFDTIADNAANAGIVMGEERHPIGAFDLRWVAGIVSRNGEVEETGLGAGVLNDPIESVVWLAQRMATYGQRIEAGHIILSGSFIRPIECPSGTEIDADYGNFGRVNLRFE